MSFSLLNHNLRLISRCLMQTMRCSFFGLDVARSGSNRHTHFSTSAALMLIHTSEQIFEISISVSHRLQWHCFFFLQVRNRYSNFNIVVSEFRFIVSGCLIFRIIQPAEKLFLLWTQYSPHTGSLIIILSPKHLYPKPETFFNPLHLIIEFSGIKPIGGRGRFWSWVQDQSTAKLTEN